MAQPGRQVLTDLTNYLPDAPKKGKAKVHIPKTWSRAQAYLKLHKERVEEELAIRMVTIPEDERNNGLRLTMRNKIASEFVNQLTEEQKIEVDNFRRRVNDEKKTEAERFNGELEKDVNNRSPEYYQMCVTHLR